MIPALRTPGSDSTLATSCWKNRARASAVSYARGSETSITSAPSRRKPGSTLCSAAKLRAVSEAPTSRISDTATCATTSARWPTERAPEPDRPERCSAERTSARAAYSAGSRPETRLLASAAASVSPSTRRSSVACSARGKPAGLKATSSRTPQAASKLPKTAPAKARTKPSANNCVTSCHRVAPSAARVASSGMRRTARASCRIATFAAAISSTNATLPCSSSSAGRTSPIVSCSSDRTLAPRPALTSGWRAARLAATRVMSSCALSNVTPGRSRATTVR